MSGKEEEDDVGKFIIDLLLKKKKKITELKTDKTEILKVINTVFRKRITSTADVEEALARFKEEKDQKEKELLQKIWELEGEKKKSAEDVAEMQRGTKEDQDKMAEDMKQLTGTLGECLQLLHEQKTQIGEMRNQRQDEEELQQKIRELERDLEGEKKTSAENVAEMQRGTKEDRDKMAEEMKQLTGKLGECLQLLEQKTQIGEMRNCHDVTGKLGECMQLLEQKIKIGETRNQRQDEGASDTAELEPVRSQLRGLESRMQELESREAKVMRVNQAPPQSSSSEPASSPPAFTIVIGKPNGPLLHKIFMAISASTIFIDEFTTFSSNCKTINLAPLLNIILSSPQEDPISIESVVCYNDNNEALSAHRLMQHVFNPIFGPKIQETQEDGASTIPLLMQLWVDQECSGCHHKTFVDKKTVAIRIQVRHPSSNVQDCVREFFKQYANTVNQNFQHRNCSYRRLCETRKLLSVPGLLCFSVDYAERASILLQEEIRLEKNSFTVATSGSVKYKLVSVVEQTPGEADSATCYRRLGDQWACYSGNDKYPLPWENIRFSRPQLLFYECNC